MMGWVRLTPGLERSQERAASLGLFTSILGHVGDGNFHQMIMYDPRVAEEQKHVEDCAAAMVDKALEMEGTVSVSLARRHDATRVATKSRASKGRTRHRHGEKGQCFSLMAHERALTWIP